MADNKKKQGAKRGTLKKALAYIGRYKYLLIVSIIFAAAVVALTLYVPIIIGDVIDMLVPGGTDMTVVGQRLLLAALLIGITAALQWFMSLINNRIAYNVVRDIRNDAFARLQILPLSYLDTRAKGDIANRIINDADQFAEGLILGFTQLFTGVLTILGTLAFMISINWIIALTVVILTPLSLFVAKFIGSRTYHLFLKRAQCEGENTAFIDEMIGNQKVVKAFAHEDEATVQFDEINERLGKHALKSIFFSSLTNPTTRFVNSVTYAAVALAGALMVIATAGGSTVASLMLTVGELSCLLSYTNQYTKPFNEISGVIAEFQNALACVARILELEEEPTETPDAPDAKVLEGAKGYVSMRGVCFSYTPDKPLIEGIDLDIKPGQRVAIVGPTGCGKTTLINLLMRFYDTTGGEIYIDGIPLREMTRESLRSSFGMVLQDTWLKSGTIRENIAVGRPDATDEEIIAAAKAAHAHSFIKRLGNGYDTVIGEDGEGLSQGQKQLLSITRVMLALPPMLILDEATSSIDTRTEIRIQKAFGKLMQGRTSFIVAHRLSTIKDADIILVMKDGNIIETGTHTELLAKNGFYSTLYNSQFAH